MIHSSESHEGIPDDLAAKLEHIFEFDQKNPHENAPQCLIELREIKDDFMNSELEDAYWNAVSIEYFHCAQAAAHIGDLQTAIVSINSALEAAKNIDSEFYNDSGSDWIPYLESTLAYLQGNIEHVKELVDTCSLNRETVTRLLHGLKKRGTPNYAEDY